MTGRIVARFDVVDSTAHPREPGLYFVSGQAAEYLGLLVAVVPAELPVGTRLALVVEADPSLCTCEHSHLSAVCPVHAE